MIKIKSKKLLLLLSLFTLHCAEAGQKPSSDQGKETHNIPGAAVRPIFKEFIVNNDNFNEVRNIVNKNSTLKIIADSNLSTTNVLRLINIIQSSHDLNDLVLDISSNPYEDPITLTDLNHLVNLAILSNTKEHITLIEAPNLTTLIIFSPTLKRLQIENFPKLKHLQLDLNKITHLSLLKVPPFSLEEEERLAKTLINTLQYLKINDVTLNGEEVRSRYKKSELIEFITHNQNPSILNFRGQGIDDTQLIYIIEALKNMQYHPRKLVLRSNKIGDGGASLLATYLSNSKIKIIDLKNNSITYKGIKELCNAYIKNPKIKEIQVDYPKDISMGDTSKGGENWYNQIIKEGFLKKSIQLNEFHINEDIQIMILAMLSRNASLGAKTIMLGKPTQPSEIAKYSDENAPALFELLNNINTIETINYHGSNIKIQGTDFFASLAKAIPCLEFLTTLNLGNMPLGDLGAIELSKGLKGNDSITLLNLNNIQITDRGLIAIAEALKNDNILSNLQIVNKETTDQGAQKLLEVLPSISKLTNISIGGNLSITLLNAYCSISSPLQLDLSNFDNITIETARQLTLIRGYRPVIFNSHINEEINPFINRCTEQKEMIGREDIENTIDLAKGDSETDVFSQSITTKRIKHPNKRILLKRSPIARGHSKV